MQEKWKHNREIFKHRRERNYACLRKTEQIPTYRDIKTSIKIEQFFIIPNNIWRKKPHMQAAASETSLRVRWNQNKLAYVNCSSGKIPLPTIIKKARGKEGKRSDEELNWYSGKQNNLNVSCKNFSSLQEISYNELQSFSITKAESGNQWSDLCCYKRIFLASMKVNVLKLNAIAL